MNLNQEENKITLQFAALAFTQKIIFFLKDNTMQSSSVYAPLNIPVSGLWHGFLKKWH